MQPDREEVSVVYLQTFELVRSTKLGQTYATELLHTAGIKPIDAEDLHDVLFHRFQSLPGIAAIEAFDTSRPNRFCIVINIESDRRRRAILRLAQALAEQTVERFYQS